MATDTRSAASFEPPIHAFLRDQLAVSFAGNISRLADACDVDPSMASKWVAEDHKRQRTPNPASCGRIAKALRVDRDYVLALAGHRDGSPAEADDPAALGALIGLLRQRWADLQEPEQRAITAVVRALTRTGAFLTVLLKARGSSSYA
jgi:hypothetical protein